MATDPIKLTFKNGYEGEMITPKKTLNVGKQDDGILPYHMLYGALGSCFYATFLSVAEKMRLTLDHAEVDIQGEKRDEVPATLKTVDVTLTIYNGSHEDKLKKAAELGGKYCSIYTTISQVATINLNVIFK